MLQLHDSTDVTRAEECIFVLSLFAPVKLITFLFPDHWNVALGWDWVRVYRNYWKLLQMWEYYEMKDSDSRRWVLKCPFHTWVIDSILEAIPHADIIWTHRNLDENMLSCSNLKSTIAVRNNMILLRPMHFYRSHMPIDLILTQPYRIFS